MKTVLAAIGLTVFASGALGADLDWHSAEKACAALVEQQCAAIGGAGCAGWWTKTAECTIESVWPGKVQPWVIKAAIAQVQADRAGLCNLCGPDPVGEVIKRAIR